MPLPAVAAGAARGLATAGRGLAKGAQEAAKRKPLVERGLVKAAEVPGEEAPDEATRKASALISVEGISMMLLGGMLDIFSIIGAILIIVFGVGLLFAKIIYIVGLFLVSTWVFVRSGAIAGKGKMRKKIVKGLLNFFKRQWPKLAGKAVPAVGDALPLWTWTIYSELTSG
jgi:hypothetical protein